MSWLGYVERMEEDRMPKKIFTEELEGTTRRGRPRKRWKEEVERDLQVLGVRRWRELVADRKKYGRTKPTVGCSANGRRRIPPGAWMFVVNVVYCQVEVSATR